MEYNLEPMSICRYLGLHCNVSEDAAPLWWEHHQGILKKTHTECCNNKIKTIKQQYYSKLLSLWKNITHKVYYYSLSSSLSSKAWFNKEEDKKMARKSLHNALEYKQIKKKDYLKFITHFGPAFTGIGF